MANAKASAALAVIDETPEDLQPATSGFTDKPDFDPRDFTYPILKLLQGISKEVMDGDRNLKAGTWHVTGDEEGRKTVTFITLGFNMLRHYRVGPDKDHLDVICSSTDGKTGLGTPGGICQICSLSEWSTNPTTGKRELLCQPTYQYVGFIPDFGLALMSLSRTATKAAKELNGRIRDRGFGTFGVTLSSSQVRTATVNYFVPEITIAKGVTPEMLQDARLSYAG